MNRIYEIYNNPALLNYHLPNFKVGAGDREIYIDTDSIHKEVKPLLIHKNYEAFIG